MDTHKISSPFSFSSFFILHSHLFGSHLPFAICHLHTVVSCAVIQQFFLPYLTFTFYSLHVGIAFIIVFLSKQISGAWGSSLAMGCLFFLHSTLRSIYIFNFEDNARPFPISTEWKYAMPSVNIRNNGPEWSQFPGQNGIRIFHSSIHIHIWMEMEFDFGQMSCDGAI